MHPDRTKYSFERWVWKIQPNACKGKKKNQGRQGDMAEKDEEKPSGKGGLETGKDAISKGKIKPGEKITESNKDKNLKWPKLNEKQQMELMGWLDSQTKSGGYFTKREFTRMFINFMNKHKFKYNAAMLRAVGVQFDRLDTNKNGKVDQDEFIAKMGT